MSGFNFKIHKKFTIYLTEHISQIIDDWTIVNHTTAHDNYYVEYECILYKGEYCYSYRYKHSVRGTEIVVYDFQHDKLYNNRVYYCDIVKYGILNNQYKSPADIPKYQMMWKIVF